MDMQQGTADQPSSPTPLNRAERRRRDRLQTQRAIVASRDLLNAARLAVLARRVTTLPDMPLQCVTVAAVRTRSLVRLPGWHWVAVIHPSDPENDTDHTQYWDVEQLAGAPLIVVA